MAQRLAQEEARREAAELEKLTAVERMKKRQSELARQARQASRGSSAPTFCFLFPVFFHFYSPVLLLSVA